MAETTETTYTGDNNKLVSSTYLYNTLQDFKENQVDPKVDKSDGYGLSQNDLTDTLKSSYDSAVTKSHTHSNKTVIDGIKSTDITNWNSKAAGSHTHNNYASTVTTTGTGNVISAITQSGNTITATKGITALTTETALSKGTTTGTGNAVTDISVSGHKITLTKGSTFLTAHPTITKSTNATTTASPAFGGSFTAIDAVTTDANGHCTKLSTKTVTLPSLSFESTALDLSTLT